LVVKRTGLSIYDCCIEWRCSKCSMVFLVVSAYSTNRDCQSEKHNC